MANERIREENLDNPDESIHNVVSQLLQETSEQEETPAVEPEEELQEEVEAEEAEVETEVEEETEESEVETEDEEEGEEVEELYYTVKINGEEYEVTLDELQSGYQRQKDYTKKTQDLSEQRKSLEEKSAELDKAHEDFISQAQLANELLNRDLEKFKSVDWEGLKENDPTQYVQKQIEMNEIRQRQTELKQAAQQVYEHNLRAQQEQLAQHVEAQRKETLKLFPDWKDEAAAVEGQRKIVEYAKSVGYTDQELSAIVNAKDLYMLDKARQFDAIQTTKEKVVKKKAPTSRRVVKSKGAPAKGVVNQKRVEETAARAKKSGSLRDAAIALHEAREAQANKRRKRK